MALHRMHCEAREDNAEDRRIITHCYLKAADLGHAALPFDMHERWAFRLLTEFYEQERPNFLKMSCYACRATRSDSLAFNRRRCASKILKTCFLCSFDH